MITTTTNTSINKLINNQITTDFILSDKNSPFTNTITQQTEQLPKITTIINQNLIPIQLKNTTITTTNISNTKLHQTIKLNIKTNNITSLDQNTITISHSFATDHHLTIDNTLTTNIKTLPSQQLTIKTIYTNTQTIDTPILISQNHQHIHHIKHNQNQNTNNLNKNHTNTKILDDNATPKLNAEHPNHLQIKIKIKLTAHHTVTNNDDVEHIQTTHQQKNINKKHPQHHHKRTQNIITTQINQKLTNTKTPKHLHAQPINNPTQQNLNNLLKFEQNITLLRTIKTNQPQIIQIILNKTTILNLINNTLNLLNNINLTKSLQLLINTFDLKFTKNLPINTTTIISNLTIGLIITITSTILPT